MKKTCVLIVLAVLAASLLLAIWSRQETSAWKSLKSPETVKLLKQFTALKEAQANAATNALPPEIKSFIGPYVDAVRDPARRPAAIAEMRRIDPKIAKQTDLIGPYLQLGAVDQVYETLFAALDRDGRSWATTWDFEHVWNVDGRKFRADPRFARLAQRIGIVDYWKQYGFPDSCQAGQDTVIVCS